MKLMVKEIIMIFIILLYLLSIISIIYGRLRIKDLERSSKWLAVYKIISIRKIKEYGKRDKYVLFFSPMIINKNDCLNIEINFIQYNKIVKNNADKVLIKYSLSEDNEYKYEFVDIV
jgi:uncharacterized membrane protein YhaH (DUF805 family)